MKCLSDFTLDQKEVGGLPSDVWCRWIRFHCPFHALFLLTDAPCYLIGTRQIQPVPRLVRIQLHCCPIA